MLWDTLPLYQAAFLQAEDLLEPCSQVPAVQTSSFVVGVTCSFLWVILCSFSQYQVATVCQAPRSGNNTRAFGGGGRRNSLSRWSEGSQGSRAHLSEPCVLDAGELSPGKLIPVGNSGSRPRNEPW